MLTLLFFNKFNKTCVAWYCFWVFRSAVTITVQRDDAKDILAHVGICLCISFVWGFHRFGAEIAPILFENCMSAWHLTKSVGNDFRISLAVS